MQVEPLFKKLENEKRFKYIFDIRRRLGDCHKSYRLCQRPIFQVISLVDSTLSSAREFGVDAGIKFQAELPSRVNSKVPKPLLNTLAIEDSSNMFPLPELPPILGGIQSVPKIVEDVVKQNEDVWLGRVRSYRDMVVSQVLDWFDKMSTKLNDIDDYLAFNCDLFGHVDACTLDLIREKMVNCFKSEYRAELLGRNLRAEEKQGIMREGLLGGQERVRSALGSATKSDDLLKKSLIPTKNRPKRGTKGGTFQQNQQQPSSSRGNGRQGRSPDSRFRDDRKRRYDDFSRREKKSFVGGRGKRNDDEDDEYETGPKRTKKYIPRKRKGEFLSPQSFSEAWPSFFSTAAILMITTVGLIVIIRWEVD